MVAARLVTSDADAIELAHEAVVRAWPRLRGWLEDDLEGQRTRHHLTLAAEDWAGAGFQGGDLYRGTRLATTQEWVGVHRAPAHGPRAPVPGCERRAGCRRGGVGRRARPHPWPHGPAVAVCSRGRGCPPRAGPDHRFRRGRPDRARPRRGGRRPGAAARCAGLGGRRHPAQLPPRPGRGQARRHAGDEGHPLPGARSAPLARRDQRPGGRRAWPPGPEPGRHPSGRLRPGQRRVTCRRRDRPRDRSVRHRRGRGPPTSSSSISALWPSAPTGGPWPWAPRPTRRRRSCCSMVVRSGDPRPSRHIFRGCA